LKFLDSGFGKQEITGRIGGDRHLGLDLDDLDSVIRNGAHLRGHAFTFTILQATVEYRASRLFLLLFAAKYQPATSLRKKSCAADGSAERAGILPRFSEVLGKPAKNARTRH
jgi:hypothetical protein